MKEPIDNLEGPPPTLEERAAMARELDAVAPTPADKFRLMFWQGPTPRMDAAFRKCGQTPRMNWQASQCYNEGCKLERELAEALEQRDRLASALEACREDSCELLGERSWWKDEERADFRERYDATAENIIRADEVLDSTKGGASD